ncbi:MAG: hypothetical protein KF798_03985 [Candidatus Paracaedibacteraceae bacterium]|nr:hypothetical protein [Candidatus Paracaedibacteraceae bacterium]
MPHNHHEDTDRIVVEVIIRRDSAHTIFQELIDGAPLVKIKSPETYHITLGFIHSIHSSETLALRDYLQNFITRKIHPIDVQQTICRAGQFQDNDAVVLFFENPISLRLLSRTIRKHLLKFHGIDSYDFSNHSQPSNYKPHMTIGDGTRRSVMVLNERIKNANAPYTIISTEIQARIIPR